jgi:hypothetical protein
MGYPGDQQQPGGWVPHQPPQSPYGPAEEQAAHGGSSYDEPHGGSSYDEPHGGSSYEAPYGGSSHGESSYGGPQDGSSRGAPYGPETSYGAESPDPYGGGPGSYDPGPSHGGGPTAYDAGEDEFGSGPNKKPWVIGAAVAAGIVVIGGGALALTSGGDSKPKPQATTQAAPPPPAVNPTPSPTETGKGDRLQSRATDPKPLTLNEIFKTRTFKSGGRSYLMTARRSDRKCVTGAHGTTFRKVLTKGGCTQVLRATFSNGKLLGTIGVFNLKTQAASDAAQTASRPKDAFVIPLPGTGTTQKIGQGLSLTTAEVNGHYLIMSWVQYPNGKKITKGDYSAVTSFVRNATLGSNLRPALNYRSMEGKPS